MAAASFSPAAVVGLDNPPIPMARGHIEKLGDPFPRAILLRGTYPITFSQLVNDIGSVFENFYFPIRKMFLVAEGEQFRLSRQDFETNARTAFSWQKNNTTSTDILLSIVAVANSEESRLQLIAYNESDNAFHFSKEKETDHE